MRVKLFQLVQGEFPIVQLIFGNEHEKIPHVFVHDNFGNEESFAVKVQEVDKFFKPIELFDTDLKGLLHMLVLKPKFMNKFLQV